MIANREAHDIWFKASHGRFDIGPCVPGKHQVQEMNGVACTFRSMGDDAGADRHHGHGESVSVCADEEYFHW